MKERKRYECLRIGSTQAHRVRARALLAYVHLHKREKIGCLGPGIFSYLKGSLRGAGYRLGLVAAEESWKQS